MNLNRRERWIVKPALILLHHHASTPKSRRDCLIESWLWRFAGRHQIADIMRDVARGEPA